MNQRIKRWSQRPTKPKAKSRAKLKGQTKRASQRPSQTKARGQTKRQDKGQARVHVKEIQDMVQAKVLGIVQAKGQAKVQTCRSPSPKKAPTLESG